ncbi:MAG TPA: hydrogenase maturation protease [Acidimicrobiales bacterium]|nr:hydrogenase maturation protease [Acidimicrobiales bacterium]
MTPGRTVVIAVGNPFASDDGVAHRIVDAARPRLPPEVEVRATHGEPARLVELWAGADLAVVVDALADGGPAGRVRVLDGLGDAVGAAGGAAGDAAGRRAGGSHALGVVDAVALGRAVGRLPAALMCVGVTGAAWGPGDELTAAVADAVTSAADAVVAAVAPVADIDPGRDGGARGRDRGAGTAQNTV